MPISLRDMGKQIVQVIPDRLARAVFMAKEYTIDQELWAGYNDALCQAFYGLPLKEQRLLITYYSNHISLKVLASNHQLSLKSCSQKLKKGLHELRKAANPKYKEAIDRIKGEIFAELVDSRTNSLKQ